MNICHLGSFSDYTGYGEASRNIVMALESVGVKQKLVNVPLIDGSPSLGEKHAFCLKLQEDNKNLNYNIRLVHTTPDLYMKFIEKGKYHIGHLFWETDRICKEWVWYCNRYDEIWTGTYTTREALIKSGVKVPIHVFPQPIDIEIKKTVPLPIKLDGYVFYSIFEWIERKNPKVLLEAFYNEFKDEQTTLLIKVFLRDFNSENKKRVVNEAKYIKEKCGITNWPKVKLIFTPLTRTEIIQLHSTGNCFVLPHRGEGWGIPTVESMIVGNPIIATGYNGVHEWISRRKDLAYLVKYEMTPVDTDKLIYKKYYEADQNWAEIDVEDLRKQMRYVFDNREEANKIAQRGRDFVIENFSYKTVGDMMKRQLLEIDRTI